MLRIGAIVLEELGEHSWWKLLDTDQATYQSSNDGTVGSSLSSAHDGLSNAVFIEIFEVCNSLGLVKEVEGEDKAVLNGGWIMRWQSVCSWIVGTIQEVILTIGFTISCV